MSDRILSEQPVAANENGHRPPGSVTIEPAVVGQQSASAGRYFDEDLEAFRRAEDLDALHGTDDYTAPAPEARQAVIVTLEEFVVVKEEGAGAVMGEADGGILIPEGGDVLIYGDGGAGKTTLTVDLAMHLGAGSDWLGIPVPQPRTVLLIESEGPRPLFRQKLARKHDSWPGDLCGRVRVFEHPWGELTFADDGWRLTLAQLIADNEIDVLIAGPLTRLGMDSAGTLQEVRSFADLIQDVRRRSERPLTVLLVHHENKAGAVSGAWEGAGDTLLHVQGAGNGHTLVYVQKARWDGGRHGTTLQLAWTEGEGFELEGDRDYLAEVCALLSDGNWRTVKELAARVDKGGIGASEKTIRELLNAHPERFESRTGEDAKAVGRHLSATVWQVRSALNAPDSPSGFSGGVGEGAAAARPLKGAAASERTPAAAAVGELDGSAHPTQSSLDGIDPDAELERLQGKGLLL